MLEVPEPSGGVATELDDPVSSSVLGVGNTKWDVDAGDLIRNGFKMSHPRVPQL